MPDFSGHLPNDPDSLLELVYQKAVQAYGDEEADGFLNEIHGGGVAAALGEEGGFVCPKDVVLESEAGARKVISYLEQRTLKL